MDRQQAQHDAAGANDPIDGETDPVEGSDLGLVKTQRSGTPPLPAYEAVVSRSGQADNQPEHEAQRQRRHEPVDPRTNECRRGVAHTLGADGRLELARVLLRDSRPRAAEAPGILRGDHHQQA